MQQGHAAKGPRAGAALVLLHLRVGLQVGPQVGAISKGPVTVLTSEGALTWLKEKLLLASGKDFINRPKALSPGDCFPNDQQITNKRQEHFPNSLNTDCPPHA